MVSLTRKRKYDLVPTQYSANRALISLCIQTVQLHSTTLTLTLDTLKPKDDVAATVPWKTFTSILDFYALLPELWTRVECTDEWPDNKVIGHCWCLIKTWTYRKQNCLRKAGKKFWASIYLTKIFVIVYALVKHPFLVYSCGRVGNVTSL